MSWLASFEIPRIDWLCLNIIAADDYLSLGEKRSGKNKVPGEYWMDSLEGRLMIDADAAVGLFVTVGGATAALFTYV